MQITNCARRSSFQVAFGQGFDSPRLHHKGIKQTLFLQRWLCCNGLALIPSQKKTVFQLRKAAFFLCFGMRKPPSDCRTASLYKGEILCLPYRGTSDFIRLLSFSEKPPVLPFCAYGFLLPVAHDRKHLKTAEHFGGLLDTDAAAFSFAHESKHPLRCILP